MTLSGVLSGTGGLNAVGGGTLTLTGVNTYTGGTRIIEATTLGVTSDAAMGASAGPVNIGNGKLLALGDFTTTRPITVNADGNVDTNGHAVALQGPVTMSVDAGQTLAFTGTSRVIGPLTLDAQGLTVAKNATLRGTGIVSSPTTVLGTLAPGNSPGTLTFTAPLTMTTGSTLELDIDGTGTGTGAGNYSRVLVRGPANSFQAAGQLQPLLRGITGNASNTYTPPVGQSFEVVRSDATILGSFQGLTQPASGLLNGSRFDALYTTNAITLYVTPASYANLTPFGINLTPNQTSTALAVNALRPAPGVRTNAATTEALGSLFVQTPNALPITLNHLSPTVYGDALVAGVERSRVFGGAVAEQAAIRRGGAITPAMNVVTGMGGYTTWATGLGQSVNYGNAGGTGFRDSSGGIAIGTDVRLGRDYLAGVAVGYSDGRTTSGATGGSADLSMFHAAIYGGWADDAFFADGQLGLNHADVAVRRDLASFHAPARGTDQGWGSNADLKIGIRYDLDGWRLQPSVGLRYDRLERDGLTETGAGALALSVDSDQISKLRSLAGSRVERRFDIGGNYHLTPVAQLYWTHDLADIATTTTAAFAGAPGTPMRSVSAKGGRDGAIVGLGATLEMPKGLAIYANYDAHLQDSATAQAVTGGIRITW